MTNILITGITGFTGTHLVKHITELHKNINIVGVGRHVPNKKIEDYEFIRCDLLNPDAIKNVVKEIKPEYVFHLAGLTTSDNLKLLFDLNVFSTLNLLEALKDIKGKIDSKILIIGSSAEYGVVKQDELPILENNLLRPITNYGISKVAQDLVGFQYYNNHELKIIRVRPFNLIGPGQSSDFVCASLARQISEIKKGNTPPEIFAGNLEQKRDFVDVRDVVKAYWKLLQSKNYGEVYNIGSGKSYAIKEILDILAKFADVKIEIKQDIKRIKQYDIPNQISDISKINREVDWVPAIPIEKSLKDMVEYYTKNS